MKKIIVVDDSAVLRTTIHNALSSAGFDVIGAAQGSQELFTLLSGGFVPDILLLDIFFPDEFGVNILKDVKERYGRIKVLVITAVNRESLNREIKQAGADEILYKPFDMDDLTAAIQRLS
ncbi:MAG: response regulator [Elusimicrobiota bacterium]|jgi:DNA-binding response OmpR family regulator|nr:response regulator [Elusimicrobiota bacterium]